MLRFSYSTLLDVVTPIFMFARVSPSLEDHLEGDNASILRFWLHCASFRNN